MQSWYKHGSWNVLCSSCKIEKPQTEFYLHSNGKPRKQCKECRNKSNKKWVEKNPEKYKEIRDKHRETHREKQLAASRSWRRNNLQYDAFRRSLYVQRKRQACPPWANLDAIKQIYLTCPDGFHVDHIIPLRGKYVSGLHVETNLQHLPAKENLSKRNKYAVLP